MAKKRKSSKARSRVEAKQEKIDGRKIDVLTKRQKEVYECVRELGSPTIREIGKRTGMKSMSWTCDCLRALVDKELVVWDRGKARGIRLVDGKAGVDKTDESKSKKEIEGLKKENNRMTEEIERLRKEVDELSGKLWEYEKKKLLSDDESKEVDRLKEELERMKEWEGKYLRLRLQVAADNLKAKAAAKKVKSK